MKSSSLGLFPAGSLFRQAVLCAVGVGAERCVPKWPSALGPHLGGDSSVTFLGEQALFFQLGHSLEEESNAFKIFCVVFF